MAKEWLVTASIWKLSDGFGWHIESAGKDALTPHSFYGSRRTAVARLVTDEAIYDAVQAVIAELAREGKLPWLF